MQNQNPCVRRGCTADAHKRYFLPSHNGKQKVTNVVHLCEPCKDELAHQPVRITAYRCGGLLFIEEVWTETE